MNEYCDVSLPVPVDQAFTYRLPATLRHRAKRGCRITVPFGSRKLTGVIIDVHDNAPSSRYAIKEALKLVDEEPVLDEELLKLGAWIGGYYCAPIGEVYRGMMPLSGETRKGKVYSLTDGGRDVARQLILGEAETDPSLQLLRLLETRPLTEAYLKSKFENAKRLLQGLEKKGFVEVEDVEADRDPLRVSAERLRVELIRYPADGKFPKPERELLSFLELHPGSHNLQEVEALVKSASVSARALARKGHVSLRTEPQIKAGAPVVPKVLNEHQQKACNAIAASLETGKFQAFLLQGVTGSGKTEVYLKCIDAALALGRNALLLVPEIALTPAVAGQFFSRFGDRVAILHSAFNDSERAEQWRRIRAGKAGVIVGTRSGVFAPIRNLGLILIDEEHDNSYKQGETPRYNGRDVAVMRAHQSGAVVVLGSATPSIETRYNADKGKYTMLELPERIEQRPMPAVELIDMRLEFLETRKQATYSRRMLEALQQRIENKEQTMLVLNRRGFSSFVACRSCGERLQCVNCSVTLTYHKRDRRMLCHYCNYAEKVPNSCPKCQSEHVHFLGVGSERAEDELHREFPEARIARLDRDVAAGKKKFESVLSNFREGNFDILVGTQMIAKGHDIANVTLAGIINADIGLGLPDFRAAERTFQLLTQTAGRAGRGVLPGIVLIQTTNPDHYAVRYAAAQDYNGFYEKELQFRRAMKYPPFAALANVVVRHQKQEEALRMSAELGGLLDPAPEGIKVLGPAEAPVQRLHNEFRYQLLIKAANRRVLNAQLSRLRAHGLQEKWNPTSLVIDVDPLTLL
jgi:primosomal protein N' (replication factor Y) (superfamily II helicase)